MKRIALFIGTILGFCLPLANAQDGDIIMNNSGALVSITEDPRYFYDPGGNATATDSGFFGLNIHDTLVMFNGMRDPGQIYVIFEDFAIGYGDTLYIYEGRNNEMTLIGFYNSVYSPEEIRTSNEYLTFIFVSDNIDDYGILKQGWKAQAYVVPDQSAQYWMTPDFVPGANYESGDAFPMMSCNTKFYDSGGPTGNMTQTSGTVTCEFISPASHVKMAFQSFDVNGVMKIYDGSLNDNNRRLIGIFHSSTVIGYPGNRPPTLFSTGSTLSVEYTSAAGDASKPGWEATITCVPELFKMNTASACPQVMAEDNDGNELPRTINHQCGIPTVINANVTASGQFTNDYTITSIPFSWSPLPLSAGQAIPADRDDQWRSSLTIPFTFYFFGEPYTTLQPSTNGHICFNTGKPIPSSSTALNCAYAYQGPTLNPAGSQFLYADDNCLGTSGFINESTDGTQDHHTPYAYKNCIYLVCEDLDPRYGGNIRYGTVDENSLNCKKFVFNIDNVPTYGNHSNKCSAQAVLYEGTNIIDIFIKKRQCCASTNDDEGIIGLQNKTNAQILIAPGRGMGGWSVQESQSEGWRFTPVTPLFENAVYSWYELVGTDTNLIGHTKKLVVDPQQTTDYIIQYHFENSGGEPYDLYDTVTVIVDVPSIEIDSATVCPGKTIQLTPRFGDTTNIHPLSYSWTNGDTTQTANVTVLTTQKQTLSVLFSNNCRRTVSTTIYVDTMDVPTITGDSAICAGESTSLVAHVDNPTYLYRWNNGHTSPTLVVHPMDTSTYVVRTFLPTDEECFTTDTFTVNVKPLPELSFTYSPDQVVMEHGMGTLYCNTNCDPNYTIVWNFNDRYDPDHSIIQDQHSVSHDFTHVGSYDITLTGTNEYDCTDSVTEHVRVYVPVSFIVPNAFSPNDDGLNDYFIPVCEGIEIQKYLMLIYDRQGRLVFRSNNLEHGWDGKDPNGLPCPIGVYTYYIHHWTQMDNLEGSGQPAISGGVTLIR